MACLSWAGSGATESTVIKQSIDSVFMYKHLTDLDCHTRGRAIYLRCSNVTLFLVLKTSPSTHAHTHTQNFYLPSFFFLFFLHSSPYDLYTINRPQLLKYGDEHVWKSLFKLHATRCVRSLTFSSN
jgi:hypothetical protein